MLLHYDFTVSQSLLKNLKLYFIQRRKGLFEIFFSPVVFGLFLFIVLIWVLEGGFAILGKQNRQAN